MTTRSSRGSLRERERERDADSSALTELRLIGARWKSRAEKTRGPRAKGQERRISGGHRAFPARGCVVNVGK